MQSNFFVPCIFLSCRPPFLPPLSAFSPFHCLSEVLPALLHEVFANHEAASGLSGGLVALMVLCILVHTPLQSDGCLCSDLRLRLHGIVVGSVLIEVETRCLVWDVVGGIH